MCSQSNFCIKIAMSVTLSHSQQSNIRDKIAVISAKIFCEQKYFLVTRISRYTIISTYAAWVLRYHTPHKHLTPDFTWFETILILLTHVQSCKTCTYTVFQLYTSSNTKAIKMVLIWLERGDPFVCFEYRTASVQ